MWRSQEYVSEALEEAEDIRLVHEVEARLARGESAWHDWEEVERELDDDGQLVSLIRVPRKTGPETYEDLG